MRVCVHVCVCMCMCVLLWSNAHVASTDSRGKPKEDTFGMNDDDWHVYREIVSS